MKITNLSYNGKCAIRFSAELAGEQELNYEAMVNMSHFKGKLKNIYEW